MGLRKKNIVSVLVSIAVIRISLKQLQWALFAITKKISSFVFIFREFLGNAVLISAFFVRWSHVDARDG
jgi:hypothetical protein